MDKNAMYELYSSPNNIVLHKKKPVRGIIIMSVRNQHHERMIG